MKRTVIGGIFSLLGTVWTLVVIDFAQNHPASSWANFPGRFLTSVFEGGMALPAILGFGLLACGLAILAVEYFKK